MTQKFYLLSKSLLTKIALVAALMSWGGINNAWGDEIVVFDNESDVRSGWTKNSVTVTENLLSFGSSTHYVGSSSNISLTNTKLVVVAKRTNQSTDAFVRLSEGYTTKQTIGYSTTTKIYDMYDSDNYMELIFDTYSCTEKNIRIYGKNVTIKSIKFCSEKELTLDENKQTALLTNTSTAKSEVVRFNYSPKNGWNTICVPFQLKNGTSYEHMTSIFGTGWTAYGLTSYSDGVIAFSNLITSDYSSIAANTPVLVYAPNASVLAEGIELLSNVYINFGTKTAPTLATSVGSDPVITFQGTYAPMAKGTLEGKYGVTSDGKLAKGGSGAWMKGYRAYLTGLTGASARIIVIDGDDETTDIGGLAQIVDDEILGKGGSKAPRAYNLQGQQVRNGKKGIYIVNGKKIVVK